MHETTENRMFLFLKEIIMIVIEYLTAILPIVLTGVATYIIIKQYKLDKKKFISEHFNERYAIYKIVMGYISDIVANANTSIKDMLSFRKETFDIKILFGEEIYDYVDEIFNKSNRLQYINKITSDMNKLPQNYTELVGEEYEILTWFGKQFHVCENMFIKYLKIDI